MWLRRQKRLNSKISYALLVLCILLSSMQQFVHSAPPLLAKERTIYYNNVPANARGDYKFDFQTTNGITTKGAGNAYGAVGVVQYVSNEGLPFTLTYTADANGYHPEGEHLPRTPFYVYKALEYIRTHPVVDEKKSRRL